MFRESKVKVKYIWKVREESNSIRLAITQILSIAFQEPPEIDSHMYLMHYLPHKLVV